MAFDHGVLNIPLSKRGNIDAQIDRFKAEQAAIAKQTAKAAAKETKSDRERAKALVAKISDAKLKALAAKSGKTPAAARKKLASMAHWEPEMVIAALA